MIATTRDIRESELLASAEAAAAISDDGLRCKTAVDQFQQPDAPGYSIAMLIPTEQVAEGEFRVDPHQNGIRALEDLIVCTDTHRRQIVLLVDPLGLRHSASHDIVDGSQGYGIVKQIAQQFHDTAVGTMADQHQSQNQLPQPVLGDRQIKQDVVAW